MERLSVIDYNAFGAIYREDKNMMAVLSFLVATFILFFFGYICVMLLLSALNLVPKKIVRFNRNIVFDIHRSIRFHQLFSWLNLSLYERAQASGTYAVIVRYARGNVLFQNGLISDDNDLQRESKAADRSMDYLNRTVS